MSALVVADSRTWSGLLPQAPTEVPAVSQTPVSSPQTFARNLIRNIEQHNLSGLLQLLYNLQFNLSYYESIKGGYKSIG